MWVRPSFISGDLRIGIDLQIEPAPVLMRIHRQRLDRATASGDRTTSVRQLLRRRPPWYALAPDEKRREAANRRQRPRSIPRLLDHHVDVPSPRRNPLV